jgi:hypothetical protein
MRLRRLKRLETKKAGEASLWIAPINPTRLATKQPTSLLV